MQRGVARIRMVREDTNQGGEGLSVLAYNLHLFGNALKAKAKAEEERRKKQRLKAAA